MWILWVVLALGFIVGSALILLRTAQPPNLGEHLKDKPPEDAQD